MVVTSKMNSLVVPALLALYFLSNGHSAVAINCPGNQGCHCYEDMPGLHKIYCSSTDPSHFIVEVNSDTVSIECINNPKWSLFLNNTNLEIGEIKTLIFSTCKPPSSEAVEHIHRVPKLLGITGVEVMRFKFLQSPLSSQELEPYPDLKRLLLSQNDVKNISNEFLGHSPSLELLDLRSTGVRPRAHTFKNSNSLLVLELGENELQELKAGVFDGLHSLALLNLWRNNLTKLEPHTFRNLSNLTSLDLHENNLENLPSDIFKDLVKLRTLNLNLNNFSSLPEGLFGNTPSLKTVKILFNKQNLTTLPPGLFSNLENLHSVTLTKVGLMVLPQDLFKNSTGLTQLIIDRNYLSTLPRKIFRDPKGLMSLSLSFNDLQVLPNKIFKNLESLDRLDLSKNHLKNLTDQTLIGLKSLTWLNVESNDLTMIHLNAFAHLTRLREARFSRNKLTLFSGVFDAFFQGQVSPFRYCQDLQELYLAYNNISEMFSDWVVGRTKLKILDLKGNAFQELESADLQFLSWNIRVDLSFNNISRINLSRLEMMSMDQKEPRNVVVDIKGNPIKCDCDIYDFVRYINGDMHPYAQNYVHIKKDGVLCTNNLPISNLRSESLKCRHNSDQATCAPNGVCDCWFRPHDRALIMDCASKNLTRAPEAIDSGNATRVELYLQLNQLEDGPLMSNPGYDKVEVLDVSGNRISELDEGILSPNLKTLNLNSNNLSYIDTRILNFWSNSTYLTKLNLQQNPWKCDCSSVDFLSFIQSRFVSIPELRDVTCYDTNRTFTIASIDELCPSWNDFAIALSTAISVFCLLMALAVIMYFRHQQQIKVWLYSKNLCMFWVSEEEVDKDKLYDAFVSYSHKDENFVVGELMKKLEDGPNPYKLCIHIRDWLAGEWITTQITNSVEQSRRTIIVLSQNFLDSEWGRMEFQTAHKQALSEKRIRLIIIILGELDDSVNMYPELKAYLQTNTYIKWGDPWFWQKLRYALPHKSQLIRPKNDQSMKINNMTMGLNDSKKSDKIFYDYY